MNILYLTCRFPSGESREDETPVLDCARSVQSEDVGVRVLHIEPRYSAGAFWKTQVYTREVKGVTVTSIVISSMFHRSIMGATPLMNLLARRYYLEQVHPFYPVDLVHAHNAWQSGAMAWALRRMHDLPYVLSEADTDLDWYFGGRWSYVPKRVYREAESVLVSTEEVAEGIRAHDPGLEQVERVPEPGNGAVNRSDPPLLRIYREALGVGFDTLNRQ